MRLVIQRVSGASVSWTGEDGREHENEIGRGLVILVGVGPEDDERTAERLAAKAATLRIFPDEEGRFNRSLEDAKGQALVVSQFTLYADTSRGRRPSFITARDPQEADHLYQHFARTLEARGLEVKTGSFGAQMLVRIDNDGPVTIALSSDDWNPRV